MLPIRQFTVKNPYELTSSRRYRLACASNDEFVAGWMRKGWVFEPLNLHVLTKILDPQSVIFDVGAHIGTYSVVLGKTLPKSRIFAFEPQLPLYSLLLKNLEQNQVANCEPHNVAVAHQEMLAAMQRAVSDGTGAGKPVSYTRKGKYNYAGLSVGLGRHVVCCVSLDRFAKKAGLKRLDLLKIDVEGAEPFVFYGARKLLKEHTPIVHFEENYKRVTSEMARGLGCAVKDPAARFDLRKFVADLDYVYFRLPFDNVMLAPKGRVPKKLMSLFERYPSDSKYFREMHVFRRDQFSPGYRPE